MIMAAWWTRGIDLGPYGYGRISISLSPHRAIGRNGSRAGALLLDLPDGKQVRIGSGLTDRLRDRPPAMCTAPTVARRLCERA